MTSMTSTPPTSSTDENRLRAAIVQHCQRLSGAGLSAGTSGNISARCAQGASAGLLISPSGVDYADLRPESLVWMDLDGRWSGPLKPSSEWRFHRDIYVARPEAGAIVHAHPTHATALAVQRLAIPAFHYMVAAAGGHDIRCARYATYGTEELSQHALAALEGRRACLLANHGMIAFGADLRRAFALAIEVETLAHQYLLARATGTPVILEAQEMDRVLEKFKSYGVNAQTAPSAAA
ncbi:class II aldolase/adducin family protein [Verminephrobacter eiseniae]|uniref:L-fuculose-phosphate aldolase n=1 Tax=Verminephrobacter eiseniae (strain EF01-2) TaxID=391735 RepID=A1WJG4_VEREI|nr:class II aldolase/adducin family protein [Verminephrobacter eiseniae]ABM57771.1 L-fuculose-phosphate aldolase [Verminephrobacter eiseniae EF01-2]MCW5283383.1 class II aldolase [Verminephrobacter eiseniae]MCW5301092.1 class II aldolase [Verminephrobacter eiseniae]MCW8182950.1 class II aldolase [Verminephrobacter eiseniae]MCW8191080.1 class II aldolase [Verminephrobacter eiseniae]